MTTSAQTVEKHVAPISPLQGEAWAAWNASYSAPVRDAYRSVGHALYQQDITERIAALFARSDEQNRYLDTVMNKQEDRKS